MEGDFYREYYELEDRHWWFVGRRRILLSAIERQLPRGREPASREILDVGCGTGTMIGYLSRFGRAQGVDADATAVSFCQQRGVRRVQHLKGGALPFEDGSFGMVTSFDVLEHLDDDLGMLKEMSRVVAPGGLVAVSVPAYRWLWGPQDEISHHRRRYAARELAGRLEAGGFRVEHLSFFNTILFPVIAATRLGRRYRPGPQELKSDFSMTGPGLLNSVLGVIFSLEAPMAARVRLPFGVSILAVGTKPVGPSR